MDAPEPALTEQIAQSWAAVSTWLVGHSSRIALAAIIGAILVALLYAVRVIGRQFAQSPANRGRRIAVIGRAFGDMNFFFMAAVAAQIVAVYAIAPPELAAPIRIIFIIAAAVQGALFLRDLILGVVEIRASEADPQGSLSSAMGLIHLSVSVVLMTIAVILILANLGIDVTGLLAGLGIGGIAIGLAAQGIFSDLFAALSILFDKPFRKGDTIRWDTTTGIVEYIGLKSSRIRALSGEEIIVSNANLLSKELRNFARIETRRINQTLSLVYHTPTAACEGLTDILAPAINGCDGCTFQRVGLSNFAASSLDFELVYDIQVADQADILVRRNIANIAILKAFGDAGILFAYPSQTTYTAAPDGSLVMPYAQSLAPSGQPSQG
jgi:small-conductance mechanosensitive channel